MKSDFHQVFSQPGSQYRGKPFWALNGELDPDEMRRQVRLMAGMGLGGFVLHSRVGLATEYLSGQWFACMTAATDEAHRLGMEVFLYDEDRWPSGAAGGLVTKDPKYSMRCLHMVQTRDRREVARHGDALAVFTGRVDGMQVFDVRRVRGKTLPQLPHGHSYLVFVVQTAPRNEWYNGYTYLDTMDPEAVDKYIEVTHDRYAAHMGEYLGSTVTMIFTDEPHHGAAFLQVQHTNPGGAAPWSRNLPAAFKQRFGYDLLHHLPTLFLDVEGTTMLQARHDYHDCMAWLLTESFAGRIGRWCEEHNIALTGHVLHEPTLESQTTAVGSAMRFYEHMQAPGIDLLTQYSREYDTAKQLSSAARQFGQTWRMTETYGCTGWDFPLAGHKALTDWQAALGINLRVPHLSLYTMLGEAKRDYPASISYQSPWHDAYKVVEDYCARLHVVASRGQEVRDLLVIHPVESMWLLCRPGWLDDPAVHKLNDMLPALRDRLLKAHLDFDYGDEDILARYGKIRGKGDDVRLVVGKAEYKQVLVPPMATIRSTTVKLLRRFVNAGGAVVFAGTVADHVDVQPSDELQELAAGCTSVPVTGNKLIEAIETRSRRVSITDADGREIPEALYFLREDDDAQYLFMCNVGHNFAGQSDMVPVVKRTVEYDTVLVTGFEGCRGEPVELDCRTGERFAVKAKRRADGWQILTSLPQLQERVFVIPKHARKSTSLSHRAKMITISSRSIGSAATRWQVGLSDPNCVVFDRATWKIGTGQWRQDDDILRIDRQVRTHLGLTPRGGQMVQPWARQIDPSIGSEQVGMRYSFVIDTPPAEQVHIALERPDLYRIVLNGNELDSSTVDGWWVDRSLETVPVKQGALHTGENVIELYTSYDQHHPGLEAVYLLGQFGVKLRDTTAHLVARPQHLRIGNWVRQGLPFYGGSVTYRRKITPPVSGMQRLFVQVPSYEGAAVRVWVNGSPAGTLAWPPYELDITDFLTGEAVELGIEVITHRRNSHGPLHQTTTQPMAVGPINFITEADQWQDAPNLVPCGLTAPPRLVVRSQKGGRAV